MEEIKSGTGLEALIQSGERLLVNFYAPWAPPSVQLSTIFSTLPSEYPKLHFASVAAEAHPSLTAQHNISTVPTILLIAHGRLLRRLTGYHPALLTSSTSWLSTADADALQAAMCEAVASRAHVVLAMKGTPEVPRCGFSRQAVEALRKNGVVFEAVDVLADQEVREWLKEWADWPTYPMLFAGGKLVGGVDIVRELAETGKLVEELDKGGDGAIVAKEAQGDAKKAAAAVAAAAAVGDTKNDAVKVTGEREGEGERWGEGRLRERLEALTKEREVMAFIKGTPDAPRCGFTRRLVGVLAEQGIAYGHFDILEDPAVRTGLKVYADWPTFPQVYCGGRFVGGLDVIVGLAEGGELKSELGVAE